MPATCRPACRARVQAGARRARFERARSSSWRSPDSRDRRAPGGTRPGEYEPPLSENDPMYFIVGARDGWTARFQLSFKYRLFDLGAGFGREQPWLVRLLFRLHAELDLGPRTPIQALPRHELPAVVLLEAGSAPTTRPSSTACASASSTNRTAATATARARSTPPSSGPSGAGSCANRPRASSSRQDLQLPRQGREPRHPAIPRLCRLALRYDAAGRMGRDAGRCATAPRARAACCWICRSALRDLQLRSGRRLLPPAIFHGLRRVASSTTTCAGRRRFRIGFAIVP